jgi:hypothetical protein
VKITFQTTATTIGGNTIGKIEGGAHCLEEARA